jgi:hypothetical protein
MTELKQSNFEEIAGSERDMLVEADVRYGRDHVHAASVSLLLSRFVESVGTEGILFARFASQAKKHHTLALFFRP